MDILGSTTTMFIGAGLLAVGIIDVVAPTPEDAVPVLGWADEAVLVSSGLLLIQEANKGTGVIDAVSNVIRMEWM